MFPASLEGLRSAALFTSGAIPMYATAEEALAIAQRLISTVPPSQVLRVPAGTFLEFVAVRARPHGGRDELLVGELRSPPDPNFLNENVHRWVDSKLFSGMGEWAVWWLTGTPGTVVQLSARWTVHRGRQYVVFE